MKTIVPILTLLFLTFASSFTYSQEAILGLWHSQGENGEGIIEIFIDDHGMLHGRLLDALDEAKNQKLKEEMEQAGATEFLVLEQFVREASGNWIDGTVYSYERDHKFSCKLELLDTDQLKLTAYFLGIFSKSFVWNRWKS